MRKLPDKIVKGCLHKKRFKDILQAKRSRQVIQVNDGPKMRIYRCLSCKGYHLTRIE